MVRARAAVGCWLFMALGCGARAELPMDWEADDSEASEPLQMRCELEGNDARVAGIQPDELAKLDGADFVVGDVKSYRWTLQKDDCDAVVKDAEFELAGANARVVTFQPSHPAFYHFTLEATDSRGRKASCKLEVPVEGVGMRVELCWDTSTTTDLDLFTAQSVRSRAVVDPRLARNRRGLEQHHLQHVQRGGGAALRTAAGELGLRRLAPQRVQHASVRRLSARWSLPQPARGRRQQSIDCHRYDRADAARQPADGQTFRVMVQNFSNQAARPHVFVYCGGQKAAAFDAPAAPPNFVSANPGTFGVMWRAADVTTKVDAAGNVSCNALPVSSNAVTVDDLTF